MPDIEHAELRYVVEVHGLMSYVIRDLSTGEPACECYTRKLAYAQCDRLNAR